MVAAQRVQHFAGWSEAQLRTAGRVKRYRPYTRLTFFIFLGIFFWHRDFREGKMIKRDFCNNFNFFAI